jgi:glutamate-1-semialdehyde 2,1-aminomutase
VFLHPWHNMFLSSAHSPAVVDDALARTEAAFADMASARF